MYLCMYLSIYVSIYLCIYLSISICLSLSLSLCLSICLCDFPLDLHVSAIYAITVSNYKCFFVFRLSVLRSAMSDRVVTWCSRISRDILFCKSVHTWITVAGVTCTCFGFVSVYIPVIPSSSLPAIQYSVCQNVLYLQWGIKSKLQMDQDTHYFDNIVWGTALQSGRSRVRFPMLSLEFFIDIILPATMCPWGRLSL
jgi:hypothetical protein